MSELNRMSYPASLEMAMEGCADSGSVFTDMDCVDPIGLREVKPVVACRGCFASERPLRPLDPASRNALSQLIGASFSQSDIFPKLVCNHCLVLLAKFGEYRKKCLTIQTSFLELHSRGIVITLDLIKSGIFGDPYPLLKHSILQEIFVFQHIDETIEKNDTAADDSIHIINTEILIPKEEIAVEFNNDNQSDHDIHDTVDNIDNISNASSIDSDTPIYNYKKDSKKSLNTDVVPKKVKKEVKRKRKERTEQNVVTELPEKSEEEEEVPDNNDKSSFNLKGMVQWVELLKAERNWKDEPKIVKKKRLKKENESDESDSDDQAFESELTDIKKWVDSLKSQESNEKKPNVKWIGKSKKTYKYEKMYEEKRLNSEREYNVRIVQLSKEDQIKQMQERKSSLNYKQAVHKCELCFRGFNLEPAYKNHMARHDVSEGEHVCEICFLRYPNKTKLNAHKTMHHRFDYICNQCGFITKSSCRAATHYKWHKGVKYDCKICGKTFDKPNSVLGHMHLTHGANMPCTICNESFLGERGLRAHMKRIHKEAIGAICQTCGVQFHSPAALRRHRPKGGCDQTLRACAACGKGFVTDKLLHTHKLSCKNKREYSCEVCHKRFDDRSKHQVHVYNHMKQRTGTTYSVGAKAAPYKGTHTFMCEMCGSSFNNKNSFDYHRRSHTGEKPFLCDYCGKGFPVKGPLVFHIRRHMAEAMNQPPVMHACQYCHKQFSFLYNKQRHELTIHQHVRPFKCDICGGTFQTKASMQNHVRHTHEGVPWPKRVRKQHA